MAAPAKSVRKRRKKRPIPINPATGLPYSVGTMKMRLLKRLKCTQKFEKLAAAAGARLIAGVDEVGRGSLFGPVVAGAVILEPGYRIKGLRDSKLLDQATREKLAERIKQHAIAYAVAAVDVARIDQLNIYWASLLAMREAIAQLSPRPDHLLIDAVRLDLDCPQTNIIHGDALSISIAAASIVAKVHRDEMIRKWAPVYPQYDLASNKGYRSPKHLAALREFGPTPLHRLSFAPVWMCNASMQEAFAFAAEEDEDQLPVQALS
ncbi:MAG TPA: ribonuclease HII [Candidatus Angelobacter sp.]|nr:ribonuclease HII [Candidatus Angelobacter sp.]